MHCPKCDLSPTDCGLGLKELVNLHLAQRFHHMAADNRNTRNTINQYRDAQHLSRWTSFLHI